MQRTRASSKLKPKLTARVERGEKEEKRKGLNWDGSEKEEKKKKKSTCHL